MGDVIRFLLNGEPVAVAVEDPCQTLLDWLRGSAHLPGTKEGCREGDCGACTVIIGKPDGMGGLDLRPVNACLVLLPAVDGRLVVTVEGVADAGELHAVQRAMVAHHASQCGFCTPGMVMSLVALQHAGDGRIDEALGGNLCRCTGYRPIVAAAAETCQMPADDRYAREAGRLADALGRLARSETLVIEGEGRRYLAPVMLERVLELAATYPEARFVTGGTDLGLLVTKQYRKPDTVIALDRVASLTWVTTTKEGVRLGAAVTYADALPALADLSPSVAALVRRIGSRQIRSVGTPAGNLANASPIGDFIPLLLALEARVWLRSMAGVREVAAADFVTGYRQTVLKPGEIIETLVLPRPPAGGRIYAYKLAKRYEQDISTVSAAIVLVLDQGVVSALRVAFGGVAARAVRAHGLEAAIVGKHWGEAALEAALPALATDIQPIDDARGSAAYRRDAAVGLLRRCLAETQMPDQAVEVMAL